MNHTEKQIHDYLVYLCRDINQVSINRFTLATIERVTEQIKNHVQDDDYFYKANEYNLNLLGKNKYKIFYGLNAEISHDNFELVKQYFDNDYVNKIEVFRDNNFRIERCPTIQKRTISDLLETNEIDFKTAIDLMVEYVVHNYILEDGWCAYPNDNNPGNFLVDNETLINIDYDHIVTTDSETMINNITKRFVLPEYEKYLETFENKLRGRI